MGIFIKLSFVLLLVRCVCVMRGLPSVDSEDLDRVVGSDGGGTLT